MNANTIIECLQSRLNAAFRGPECRFIRVNFSTLTERNKIFRNDFVYIHYQLCKISAQIIECKIFALYEPSIYNNYLFYGDTI